MRLRDTVSATASGVSLQRWSGRDWRPVAIDTEFARAFTGAADVQSVDVELGNDVSPVQESTSGEVLEFEPGVRALLLLPGSWVWNGLETVPRAARRQSSAVGYMVEERLAEDVEDLHFNCEPVSGDLCSVMAISRERLEILHTQITRLQWPITVAVPEYRLLSALKQEPGIWLDDDYAHIWAGNGAGLSVSRSLLLPVAESLLVPDDAVNEEEIADGGATGRKIQLLGQAESLEQGSLSQLGELEVLEGPAEAYLMEHYSPTISGNLLTGEYQVVLGNADGPWWRKPAIAVAACFVAQLLFFVGAGVYYKVQAGRADATAQQMFAEIFPGTRPQADLRRQIAGYLNQSGGGSSDFAGQLQQLSSVWNSGKPGELKLQSLRFDGNRGELVLQLRAANLAQLDSVVNKLSSSQYKAELLAANELEEGVSGRIRLR